MPLDLLQRGQYQPRIDMRQEALEELAISIRTGRDPAHCRAAAWQPAPGQPQRYEIIAGERRWRAAKMRA